MRRWPTDGGPVATTATPHPAGWLRAATCRLPRQEPSALPAALQRYSHNGRGRAARPRPVEAMKEPRYGSPPPNR
eukprot:2860504-Alexandrium_andersonii.AAC.1